MEFWGDARRAPKAGESRDMGRGVPSPAVGLVFFCVLMCVCVLRAVADAVIYTTLPSLGELTIKSPAVEAKTHFPTL